MRKLLVIGAAVVSGSLLLLSGQEPAPPPAVYTAAQATAGRTAYQSSCGKCHTDKLTGRTGEAGELPEVASLPANMQKVVRAFGGKVPPLVGEKFIGKWRTTKDLANRIKEAVGGFPPENSDDETHLKLTAYFLQVNGGRAGTEALTKDTAVDLASLNLNSGSTQRH